MKSYSGRRAPDGSAIVTRADGSELPPRLDLANHSPTGFEWGYGGSGPAQLALAILADCLEDDERALDLHQEFKAYAIARLPDKLPWSINEDYVRKVAGELARARLRVVSDP